jgi:FkbH-like protein
MHDAMAIDRRSSEKNSLRQTLREAATAEEALGLLSKVEFRDLSAADVGVIQRRLAKLAGEPGYRIAYLGNITLDPLADYLEVCCACEGLHAGRYLGAYNQHFQELLDADGPLQAFRPDLIFLALSLRDLAPKIFFEFASLGQAERETEFERICGHFRQWVETAGARTNATLLVANLASPAVRRMGIADLKDDAGEGSFYVRLNQELLRICGAGARCHILDLDGLTAKLGKRAAFNERLYYLARREWDESLLPELAHEVLRYVLPLTGRACKCLVLDLDNTLWGGVVGEDGPSGLKIAKGDPQGEAFRAFQHAVIGLKERGVILAVASKNNPGDVEEAFALNPDMPLKLDDFAALEISWNNKHESLLKIADRLNIGIDSLVFIDDNPVECALVKEMLPEVKTICLPEDPSGYAELLYDLAYFERLSLTAEDRAKARHYAEDRKRTESRGDTVSLDNYLQSLGTEIVVRRPAKADAARVHQLFTKTNQFNVTTKRHGPGEVEHFMTDPAFDIRVVDVKDSFGDLGTVGLVLIERCGAEARIDSFILSCRAMGRGIETAIMNCLKEDYLRSGQTPVLKALFIPTAKNVPVKRFYDDQGFDLEKEAESGERHYRLEAGAASLAACQHIAVSREE